MIKIILLAAAAAGAFAAAKVSAGEKKPVKLPVTETKRGEAAINDPKTKEYDMDYMYV